MTTFLEAVVFQFVNAMYDEVDNYDAEARRQGVEPEALARHIGMFMTWAVLRGLHNADEDAEGFDPADVEELQSRRHSCSWLVGRRDGKFVEADLNEEGNAFARAYYATGKYFTDFCDVLGDARTPIADTWEHFDLIARMLDERLGRFRNPKPWWRFW